MTEFFLSKLAESVISEVVQKLSNLFVQEASSISTMKEDVRRMQEELRLLQCFLKEVDRIKEQDDRLCNLVDQVRDLAYDLEDAIAIYDNIQATSSYSKACRQLRFQSQIDSMRNRTSDIKNSMLIYGGVKLDRGLEGPSSVVGLTDDLRRTCPDDYGEQDDVVTLEDSFKDLKDELMKEEDELRIVSVVGMGGLGKTTLTKQVYNSSIVKQQFDCSAWVFISQQYNSIENLIEILTQVGSGYEEEIARKRGNVRERLEEKTKRRETLKTMKQGDLMDLLKDELKEKRYLVVLDDIWKIEAWDSVKKAFPKGKKGSKVVFTTRIKQVSLNADPFSRLIEPPLLSAEESWQLLRRKAFRRSIEPGCLQKYQEVGREMLKRCGGLPLAVVVLGGLLRTKASVDEWKTVQRDVTSQLQSHEKQYEGVQAILGLSYVDLPYHLKPCFLYLGNFPEDSEIYKRKLVKLWIAEGFIPAATEQQWEDKAEEYLQELVERCMVQVTKRDHTGKGVKTFRMHDIMRDLCVSKAREEKFLDIIFQQDKQQINMETGSTSCHVRRISVHRWEGGQVHMHAHLRSMLLFPFTWSFLLSTSPTKSYKLLRVLDIRFSDGFDGDTKMLTDIGNLVHLRYLGLGGLYRLKLPNSIGNLLNLHTLDLQNNEIIHNLRVITRLTHLRHLLLPYSVPRRLLNPHWSRSNDLRLDELQEIQTLKGVEPDALIRHDLMSKLTSLQNLHILCKKMFHDYSGNIVESPVVKSGQLRSLSMLLLIDDKFPILNSLTYCHHLSKMDLSGRIKEINHDLLFLPSTKLTKLRLRDSQIQQDPMQVLEKLPNLRHLYLWYQSYIGSQMVCSAHGFHKLETLSFDLLNHLEEWQVEKGAMPSLKSLSIDDLKNLRCLPEGLRYVTTLQELNVRYMPLPFVNRLKLEDGSPGQDFDIVHHVPSLNIKATEE